MVQGKNRPADLWRLRSPSWWIRERWARGPDHQLWLL